MTSSSLLLKPRCFMLQQCLILVSIFPAYVFREEANRISYSITYLFEHQLLYDAVIRVNVPD